MLQLVEHTSPKPVGRINSWSGDSEQKSDIAAVQLGDVWVEGNGSRAAVQLAGHQCNTNGESSVVRGRSEKKLGPTDLSPPSEKDREIKQKHETEQKNQ